MTTEADEAAAIVTRRRFMRRAVSALGVIPAWDVARLQTVVSDRCADLAASGQLVRTLPLYGPGAQDAPLGTVVGGEGLDARLFTDLTGLQPGRMVTATPEVFVRTAAPAGLDLAPDVWQVRLGETESVFARALVDVAAPMGTHLIECAGNSNPQHFGLMSAVEWRGVPLASVLDRTRRPDGAAGVLVIGADPATSRAERSVPGASWVVPTSVIESGGPFLATGMNGGPLPPDHGAPVRLVIPGWYGCAWIKWVTAIRWIDANEPSTSQMLEYAVRTHQDGRPALAGDYAAPVIDTAAMPIRVEQRRVDGALVYDVVGIVWGGDRPVDRLAIRVGPREPWQPVPVCPPPASTRTWTLWRYRWRPQAAGYYDITLKVADASVRTRRLDLSFYIRRVRIDEV